MSGAFSNLAAVPRIFTGAGSTITDPLGLYNKPKTPGLPAATPTPTWDDAAAASQNAGDSLARRRGMASTVLGGTATQPTTQASRLLGS